MKLQWKKATALLLAAFIALPAIGALNANRASAAVSVPADHVVSDYDYFTDVFPGLTDANHVFKNITYEDLVHVLGSAGTYAILFGGPSDPSTQADIAYVNEVAKAKGIKTVYVFDTKLDGQKLDIADSGNSFANVYSDLVAKFLTAKSADGTPVAASPASDVKDKTFLFVYNKDNKDASGNRSPIVSSLLLNNAASNFQTNGAVDSAKIDAFKAQVSEVFGHASSYDTIDPYDFIAPAFNRNVLLNLSSLTQEQKDALPPIFTPADGPLAFEHVTYPELQRLLGTQGNFVILFGGSWCPNTQAAIHFINEYAHKYNIQKIYFWDPRLDAGVDVTKIDDPAFNSHDNDRLMIRDTKNSYSYLYVDLVNKYLTNISTQYDPATNNVNYKDANGNTVSANKLQVPYLFVYNKDNKDADGKPAPILGHVELMYGWNSIQPGAVDKTGVEYKYNETYKAALDTLFSRVESVPTGLTALAPTTGSSQDGQIVGVDNRPLEYKKDGETAYKPATGSAITGLEPGTYQVRYASKAGYQGPVKAGGLHTEIPYPAGQSVDIVVPQAQASFTDVDPGAWYGDSVRFLVAEGITTGTDETHFSPNSNITRGQFVVQLLKAYGVAPEADAADNFSDAGDAYYTGYLAAAKRLGIATGSGNNAFAPNAAISRQELFTLLYRALNVLGKLPTEKIGAGLSGFSDAEEVAGYAQDAVQALVKSGILTGSGGKLNPKDSATRAQVAKILYGLLAE